MSLLPQYIHIVNPKLKHIYLMFDGEGNLVIKSPKVSQDKIEHLLLQKSSWINHSRAKLLNKKGKTLDFTSADAATVYFMGEAYPLMLKTHQQKKVKLVFDGACFTLHYQTYDKRLFQSHLDHFYKIEAQKQLPSRIDRLAKEMSLAPSAVRFRKTKRQWGSCSSKNALSFNTMMMKLPLSVIEYIIVHELAHITHKHHQKAFWQLVQRYLPQYKMLISELKTYTT